METTTLALDKKLVDGLQQLADESGISVEDLAEKAIFHYIREEADKKIDQEEAHYKAQHAELLQMYAGRYIAMHEGKVIDTDSDQLDLYLRVRQHYPLVGILIKKVTTQVEVILHMRSPRWEYK